METQYTYLMHYAQGTESKNHAYVDRKWVNGKWQYIYDAADGGRTNSNIHANVNSIGRQTHNLGNHTSQGLNNAVNRTNHDANQVLSRANDGIQDIKAREQRRHSTPAGMPSYVTQEQHTKQNWASTGNIADRRKAQEEADAKAYKRKELDKTFADAQAKYQKRAARNNKIKAAKNQLTSTAELVKNWGVRTANRAKTWAVNTGNKVKDTVSDAYNNATYQIRKKRK